MQLFSIDVVPPHQAKTVEQSLVAIHRAKQLCEDFRQTARMFAKQKSVGSQPDQAKSDALVARIDAIVSHSEHVARRLGNMSEDQEINRDVSMLEIFQAEAERVSQQLSSHTQLK